MIRRQSRSQGLLRGLTQGYTRTFLCKLERLAVRVRHMRLRPPLPREQQLSKAAGMLDCEERVVGVQGFRSDEQLLRGREAGLDRDLIPTQYVDVAADEEEEITGGLPLCEDDVAWWGR